jgi:hypothetical protein
MLSATTLSHLEWRLVPEAECLRVPVLAAVAAAVVAAVETATETQPRQLPNLVARL